MSIMGTSVSGLLADSSWLSNISQNVSNANTVAYKDENTEFSTVIDQVGGKSAASGGGVAASARSLNSMQGAIVGTTTTTDLAVRGDGYFVVSDASGDLYLTRNGSFVPDASGDLVNSAGYYLMGYDMQNDSTAAASDSLAGMTKVNVTTAGEAANPTTSGALSVNLDSNSTAVASTATLPSADPPAATANYTSETSLVTYDNLGGSQTVNIYYTNISTPGSPDTWEVTAYNAADATNGGFPYQSGGVNVAPLATATLTFDPTDGKLASTTQNGTTSTTDFNLNLTAPGGQPMTLNLGSSTQLAAAFSVNSSSANGNAPSSLSGISISASGTLNFQYSNGLASPGYEIPLATVPSEDNLTSVNGDAFEANQNSGSVRVGTAGAGGLGTVASSSLEDSTVDLATQLTQMIEAQSAYQANSKAFQAGADILDVINNLKP